MSLRLLRRLELLHDNSDKLWRTRSDSDTPGPTSRSSCFTTDLNSTTTHAYRLRLLEGFGNVSLLERPLDAVTMVSAIRAAIARRERQVCEVPATISRSAN